MGLTGHIKALDTINGVLTVESTITWQSGCQISHYSALRQSNQPLLGIPTVVSAVLAPLECGRAIHLESTYFVHFLQRLDADHDLEGVMTPVVSTNVALKGTFLNQDTRSMVEQSKVGTLLP